MQTLHQATAVKPVKRLPAPLPQTVTLPRGTRYETVRLTFDPLGYTVKRIAVRGEQYDMISY